MSRRPRLHSERGAVLIHVATALIALLAVSSFAFDNGVKFVSRRQAQNAVDSAALAGALGWSKGDTPAAIDMAAHYFAANNQIWGEVNSAANVDVALSGPGTPIPPCDVDPGCVRVDVFRNTADRTNAIRGNVVPTYFARFVGVGEQGVRATATAWVTTGNRVKCLLPFTVIDRWADNHDPTPDTRFFANDNQTGTAGWSPNDEYISAQGDVYIGPYEGNTNHTGWRVTSDYGRQLVIKTDLGTYSNGWANIVYLPGSIGANDVKNDIETCNEQPIGIAELNEACPDRDEPHGCLQVKEGTVQGPIRQGIVNLVGSDSGARWNRTAPGPNGPTGGAVVGGEGMSTPRIRPIAVTDIDHFEGSECTGGTCIAKVSNIIGFFIEGMCNTVALDPGVICEEPNKMVVGRIVTLPATYYAGSGSVEESAAFLKVVQLVR